MFMFVFVFVFVLVFLFVFVFVFVCFPAFVHSFFQRCAWLWLYKRSTPKAPSPAPHAPLHPTHPGLHLPGLQHPVHQRPAHLRGQRRRVPHRRAAAQDHGQYGELDLQPHPGAPQQPAQADRGAGPAAAGGQRRVQRQRDRHLRVHIVHAGVAVPSAGVAVPSAGGMEDAVQATAQWRP